MNKDDFIFFSVRIIDSDISNVSDFMISNFIDLYKRDYYFLVTYYGVFTDINNLNVFAFHDSNNFIAFVIFLKDYVINSLPFNIISFSNDQYKSLLMLKVYSTTIPVTGVVNNTVFTPISHVSRTVPVNGSTYYRLNLNLNVNSFFIRFNTSFAYVSNYQAYHVYNNRINLMYLSLNDEIYYSLYMSYNSSTFKVGVSHFSSSDMVLYPYHVVFSPLPSFYSFGFTYSNISGVNMMRYSTFYRNLIYRNHYNSALFYENRTYEDMNQIVNGEPVNGVLPFSDVVSGYNVDLFNNLSSKFNINNYNVPNNVSKPQNYYNTNIRKITLFLNQDFFVLDQFTFTDENPSASDFNNTINVTYKDLSIIQKISESLITNNM
ncbi:MAG: hypothetical protein QXS19_07725 [Candidatus Methanomethylicia archaeon]